MKKLTKKQRHEIYKKALELTYNDEPIYYHEYIKKNELGLCTFIGWGVFKGDFTNVYNRSLIEMYLFEPDNNPDCWYKDYDSVNLLNRQLVLMFCIEMTR